MQIILSNIQTDFRPWRPEMGQVLEGIYAFDCETTLIDDAHPWITPAYVLGAACDARQGYFVRRDHVGAFFAAHRHVTVAMHHAAFDLDVVRVAAPDFDIYGLVDDDLVWDTQLLHRLYMLGTEGHTASLKGQSTLEHCASRYLGVSLSKDVQDSHGRNVRTSYGQWLSHPPQEIEPIYLEYLAKDVIATLHVFQRQRHLLHELISDSAGVFGYVSPQWLSEQVHRWGWQTHHIQLKGAIALRAVTTNGLGVDVSRRDELLGQLDQVLTELRQSLRTYGYLPGQAGSSKALQEILVRLDRRNPDLTFLRTPTGKYATSREALAELVGAEPFVRDLLEFRETEKLKSSFLQKMGRRGRRRLHPSFNPLMVSGRTSSFGEINAQNLPRDDRVRSCFVPTEGHIFVDADYCTVELATLAQAVRSQFRLQSRIGDAINAGQDLHRVLAARVTGKPEGGVTGDERQMAKPVNFGLPGGMGIRGLQRYASASYGVELSEGDAQTLHDAWLTLFPEMTEFLRQEDDLGQRAAEFFNLNPLTYFEHTGRRQLLDNPEYLASTPVAFLGGMFLKTLKVANPKTRREVDYKVDQLDYFWARAASLVEAFPKTLQPAVRAKEPSPSLQRAAIGLVGRQPVYTLTGRLRANATFCARHNTVFQGLAADGAKLALWQLWRAGYRIANFIHDEVLIEIPHDSDWKAHAERIKELMIEGMQQVVPNIRIDVEYSATDRWFKGAEQMFDDSGRLCLWRPPSLGETETGLGSSPSLAFS